MVVCILQTFQDTVSPYITTHSNWFCSNRNRGVHRAWFFVRIGASKGVLFVVVNCTIVDKQ